MRRNAARNLGLAGALTDRAADLGGGPSRSCFGAAGRTGDQSEERLCLAPRPPGHAAALVLERGAG